MILPSPAASTCGDMPSEKACGRSGDGSAAAVELLFNASATPQPQMQKHLAPLALFAAASGTGSAFHFGRCEVEFRV